MLLLFFVPLRNCFSVHGQANFTIRRVHSSSHSEYDKFKLPSSLCLSGDPCRTFHARRTPNVNTECSCSCTFAKATAFSRKNGSWECIGNKEIREGVLGDCKRARFKSEKTTDVLRTFQIQSNLVLKLVSDTQCIAADTLRFSYQACDGKWIPLNSSVNANIVTTQGANANMNYLLTIKDNYFWDLKGRIVKLDIAACKRTTKPVHLCLLFKMAGDLTCSGINVSPSVVPTTTTRLYTEAVVTTSDREGTGRSPSRVTASKPADVTIVPVSTEKAPELNTSVTNPTDSGQETIHVASHEVPVTLICGLVASAVIVLLSVVITTMVICRRRNARQKTGDESANQDIAIEEQITYQSLLPTSDGVTERGLYVSPYNIPERLKKKTLSTDNNYHSPVGSDTNKTEELYERAVPEGLHPSNPAGDPKTPEVLEYDYAESRSLCKVADLIYSEPSEGDQGGAEEKAPLYHVLEGNSPSESYEDSALKEPSDGAFEMPTQKAPYYHELEGAGSSLEDNTKREPKDIVGKVPNEKAPYYHELEGTGPLDLLEENTNKEPNDVAHKDANEKAPYYLELEGPLDSQEDFGYKELQAEGRLSLSYQPLHKYTYVSFRDKHA